MHQQLHIISLDVPYPVDHGGLFDLFYKLQALKRAGVGVHLHCFEYGRGQQVELEQYCESVHYYARRTGLRGISNKVPYIVHSRQHPALTGRLLADDHPILMEGIHCTALLNDKRFKTRNKLVRLHNVEYEYYHHLSRLERSPLKKLYYAYESRLLKNYEGQIAKRALFLAVSEKDAAIYRLRFQAKATFLPVFVPWKEVQALPGRGNYCLYHGNLSVPENEKAATWLVTEVFADAGIPFVIAGRRPSRKLSHFAGRYAHVSVVADPDAEAMQNLIQNAHVNILPSLNSTGVKLKLLHALFMGRHCITGGHAVEGTGMEGCCHIADDAASMKAAVIDLMQQDFTDDMTRQRSAPLTATYNNDANCRRLTGMIW
ncbi:MAG TPA: glycosyltransferase family 4 protein [Chitinophagaceae bacterium]|nr:glycosyltransferase family 4 protein [Chitinophagaceae bacterium]